MRFRPEEWLIVKWSRVISSREILDGGGLMGVGIRQKWFSMSARESAWSFVM